MYNTESAAPYLDGFLDPTWFDNVQRDNFVSMELSQLPDWCPSTLQMLANNMCQGMFVAGGACMTIFDKFHRFTDYDVWVNTDEAYAHVSNLLLLWGFKADSMTNQLQHWKDGFSTVQIIRVPKLQCLEDLLSTFDIQACKVGFDAKGIKANLYTKGDIESKQINIAPTRLKSKDPGKLLYRVLKYGIKGYNVPPQLIRNIWNTNKEPIQDPNAKSLGELKEAIAEMIRRQSEQVMPIFPSDPNDQSKWYTMPSQMKYTLTSGTYGSSSGIEDRCGTCGSMYHSTANHLTY